MKCIIICYRQPFTTMLRCWMRRSATLKSGKASCGARGFDAIVEPFVVRFHTNSCFEENRTHRACTNASHWQADNLGDICRWRCRAHFEKILGQAFFSSKLTAEQREP